MADDLQTAPTADTPADEKVGLTLSSEALAAWRQRISAAVAYTDHKREGWKASMRAYMAKVLSNVPIEHQVNVPIDFAFVELKKAQLAFQVPEVVLKAKRPGLEQAMRVFQGAVNHELGDDHADAKTLIDECLMDVLICGVAASKISYVAHVRERMVPVMRPRLDPLSQQPVLDPTTQQPLQDPVLDPETGEVQMLPEKYLAGEEYRWDRFPPEDLLVPSDFEQARFDRAAWLGMRFRMDLATAKQQGLVPDDFSATQSRPRDTLSSDEQPNRDHTTTKQVTGYEIWLKADVFDPTALPGRYRKLVLIDGHDREAAYEDSRSQFVDADGKVKGMMGNPIHPLTLRFLPGSPSPMSDVEMGRPLSEELSVGRTQMIQFRNRVLPRWGFNRTGMDPETLAKLESGTTGSYIGFDGDPDDLVKPLTPAQYQRENFTFDQVVRRDIQQTWATSATPGAQIEPASRTATEVNNAQGTADVRLDNERTWFLRWFCRGAGKFASLLQLFKDDAGFAEIVGDDGVKALQAWNRQHIQGEYAFTAKPDSSLRLDADTDRRQSLNLYNLLGKDPNVNRVELLNTVLLKHNIDPSKIVVQTPPPAPHPEPPKINLSFKGEDLDNPMVLAILQQLGIQLPTPPELAGLTGGSQLPPGGGPGESGGAGGAPPTLAQLPSPPHPGATPQATPLNKHALVRDQAQPR